MFRASKYLPTIVCCVAGVTALAQNSWVQVADAGINGRYLGVGFTIGPSGYVGLGSTVSQTTLKDFWEFSGGAWTQRADFEGDGTIGATGFSIDGKGYVVFGADNAANRTSAVWQYDPSLNDWIPRNASPARARALAVGFVIGSKAYIGTGIDNVNAAMKDFWKYDPVNDSWVQLSDFGGAARFSAASFSVDGYGFVTTGTDGAGAELNDMWKYDPGTNAWIQKTNFPGDPRTGAIGLSIGSSGFVGTGLSDAAIHFGFWQYFEHHDSWLQATSFTGGARFGTAAFVLDNKAYIGTGRDATDVRKDFYEYTPHALRTLFTPGASLCAGSSGTVAYGSAGATFNSGNTFSVELSDASGSFASPTVIATLSATSPSGSVDYTIPLSTPGGTGYRVRVTASAPPITGADNGINITITDGVAASVSIVAAPGNVVCSNTEVTFTATPTAGGASPTYEWKKNGTVVSSDGPTLVYNGLHNGDVIQCWMTSSLACATPSPAASNAITMTVNPLLATAVSVDITPGSDLCGVSEATFTATPTNGGPTPTYEWKRNNLTVGTNSPTYSPTNLQNGDVIKVFMTSSEACGAPASVESEPIAMNIETPVTPLVTITAPDPVCSGKQVTLTAVPVNGGATPSFQWKKNGVIVGTNSAEYQDTFNDGDDIVVELTTSKTCVTSTTATSSYVMRVTPSVLPTIEVMTSPSTDVPAGTCVVMTTLIEHEGTAPSFDWKVNGVSQGTGSRFVIDAPVDGASVTCTLTSNAICVSAPSVTSSPTVIHVDATTTRDHHSWERKPGFGTSSTNSKFYSAGFMVNGRFYISTGMNAAGADTKDTWEYNPTTNVWTQKTDLPGAARHGAVGFSIGMKGYVVAGYSNSGGVYRKDIWEYDPFSNTWFQRGDLPAAGRKAAAVFVSGNKAYVGTGVTTGGGLLDDFWEFDPLSGVWTSVAPIPGGGRHSAAAFGSASNGYVLAGVKAGGELQDDVWQFSTTDNQWTQKSAFPGGKRRDMIGFASGNYGFAGGGSESMITFIDQRTDFWHYETATETWIREQDFEGYDNTFDRPPAGAANGKAYVFSGNKFFEFSMLSVGKLVRKVCQGEVLQVPFASAGVAPGSNNVYSVQVSPVQNFSNLTNIGTLASDAAGGTIPVTIPTTASGNIYLRVVSSNPVSQSPLELMEVNAVNRSLTINATPNNVCQGTPVTFKSSLGSTDGHYQWMKNSEAVGTSSDEYIDSELVSTDVVQCVLTYTDVCSNPLSVTSNSLSVSLKTVTKPTITISGNTLTSSLAVGYQWYKGNKPIASANNQTLLVDESGKYKVEITGTNGCSAVSDPIDVVFTSVDVLQEGGIRFYPNPFSDNLEVDASELVSGVVNISIINELGQTVFTKTGLHTIERFSLGHLPAGLYLLKADDGKSVSVHRIVKLR